MKTCQWRSGMAVIGVLLTAASGGAQEKKADLAAAMQANQPGPAHKQLARRAGEYTTVSKFWIKPGDTPQESKGTAKITTVLGGRFLQEEHTGTMLGMPFTSLHLDGYNNATKQYEASWAYTGSTSIMTLTGTSKDDGKTITYTAAYINEIGAKETLAIVARQIDDDHFVVELSGKNPDGSKGPTMETTYTRKK